MNAFKYQRDGQWTKVIFKKINKCPLLRPVGQKNNVKIVNVHQLCNNYDVYSYLMKRETLNGMDIKYSWISEASFDREKKKLKKFE